VPGITSWKISTEAEGEAGQRFTISAHTVICAGMIGVDVEGYLAEGLEKGLRRHHWPSGSIKGSSIAECIYCPLVGYITRLPKECGLYGANHRLPPELSGLLVPFPRPDQRPALFLIVLI